MCGYALEAVYATHHSASPPRRAPAVSLVALSQVDLCAPCNTSFPRLARAVGSVVTLAPGDVLFLPAYWWHEVITEPSPP